MQQAVRVDGARDQHELVRPLLIGLYRRALDGESELRRPTRVLVSRSSGARLRRLAAGGARIVVLEQEAPLAATAFEGAESSSHTGRMAFAQSIDHPVFAGLTQDDLSFWSRGHVVYRNPYKSVPRGAASLVLCDEELGYTALASCPIDDGLILLGKGPKGVAKEVASLVLKRVEAKGKLFERHGVRYLDIASVKPAPEREPLDEEEDWEDEPEDQPQTDAPDPDDSWDSEDD